MLLTLIVDRDHGTYHIPNRNPAPDFDLVLTLVLITTLPAADVNSDPNQTLTSTLTLALTPDLTLAPTRF